MNLISINEAKHITTMKQVFKLQLKIVIIIFSDMYAHKKAIFSFVSLIN